MSDTMVADATSVDFSATEFRRNAKAYAEHKRVVDAIATGIAKANGGYDNFDDAIAQIRSVWDSLRDQVTRGGGYTPDAAQGFGSNNAAQIASALTGDKTSVTEIRKAFATLGK